MSVEVPIGEREKIDLEFKRAAALDSPETISRAVVAMLNADGGTIWVGVGETDERASSIESVRDIDRQKRSLEDHLIDSIEPSPIDAEVAVEVVESVLRIRVQTSDRRPFAQVRQTIHRYYPIRVGARVRLMTHEELRDAFRAQTKPPHDAALTARATKAWDDELENGRSELWVFVSLPEQLLRLDQPDYENYAKYIGDPAQSRNRTMGWNFCTEYQQLRTEPRKRVVGGPDEYTWAELGEDGTMHFRAPIARLEPKVEGELYPYALVEYLASGLRLAGRMYSDHLDALSGVRCVVDAGLLSIGGKTLRPGSPRSMAFELNAHPAVVENVRAGPLVVEVSELCARPDPISWHLTTWIYEAFGFDSRQMPNEMFDAVRSIISVPG